MIQNSFIAHSLGPCKRQKLKAFCKCCHIDAILQIRHHISWAMNFLNQRLIYFVLFPDTVSVWLVVGITRRHYWCLAFLGFHYGASSFLSGTLRALQPFLRGREGKESIYYTNKSNELMPPKIGTLIEHLNMEITLLSTLHKYLI